MQKLILIAVVLIVVAGLAFLGMRFLGGDEDAWICQDGAWIKHGNPSSSMPTSGCGNNQVDTFEECILAGYPIMESYPQRCVVPDGETFIGSVGNEAIKTDLIKITNPRPNQIIKSPLAIEGEARGNWYFEASFPVRLYDANGNQLGVVPAQAQREWMTTNFVPFKATLEFSAPTTATGKLVLEKDNPSGLPEHDDQLWIPVRFDTSVETITVKAFFNNSEMDPEVSCNKVFPATRTIYATAGVARAALEEVLKGPTESEKADGFFTSINQGVRIEKLAIANSVASVEFDEQLEFQVGGSCRVSAIRAQIVETLKQFPTVKDVVISINGRTEDILQP